MGHIKTLSGIFFALTLSGQLPATSLRAATGPSDAQPDNVQIDIHATGPDEATRDLLLSLARDRMEGGDHTPPDSRILGIEFDETSKNTSPGFRILTFNYVTQTYRELKGTLSDPSRMESHLITLPAAPAPSPEEFDAAVAIVRQDPALGQGEWDPYIAMPGTDPDEPSRRVVTIGLRPREGSSFQHEIVGVDLGSGQVKRYPGGAPSTAIATQSICAPPDSGQWVTGQGWAGQAQINVKQGDVTLWNLTAVRPSASSGFRSSGIELRDITYKGQRIAGAIHVPILNVRYIGDVCGPYRDWTYSESAFEAQGTAMAPGFIRATSKPSTIYESGVDGGNYRGVAVYREGNETVLVSVMSAGWYRYKSEFRLNDDGSIRPIWGFAGVQSSCTCHAHVHHAYYRMDLDMSAGNGAHDLVQYWDGAQWVTVQHEGRFARDAKHYYWRVIDPATGRGMEVIPGADDGTADDYGTADIWALRQHDGEIDDSRVNGRTVIGIDSFVNGESLNGADAVLWYGVHFLHVNDNHLERHNGQLGPTLVPIQVR